MELKEVEASVPLKNICNTIENGNIADEIIDVTQIDFSNDETWLYKLKCTTNLVEDLHDWLYEDFSDLKNMEFHYKHLSLMREISKLNSKKSIDTRTFTRPKKKSSRPSIELCNETFNSSKTIESNTTCSSDTEVDGNLKIPNFDLTQPISSDLFDNVLNNSKGIDSFINMSPPSLVNSMCSSTFMNTIGNNTMKDETVILKTSDYSEQILLQDTEQPLFRSYTGSCSSLSSDTQDNFLKKTLSSFNGTLKLHSSKDDVYKSLNNSDSNLEFSKIWKNSVENCYDDTITGKSMNNIDNKSVIDIMHSENIDPNATFTTHNTTYKRITNPVKLNNTYDKSQQDALNSTYQKISSTHVQKVLKPNQSTSNCINTTYTEPSNKICDTFTKKVAGGDISSSEAPIDSLNINFPLKKRGSLSIVNGKVEVYIENGQISSVHKKSDDSKGTFINSSTGSVDSLDRLSNLSNSSRGSSKMLNMAEVDAIVEMQERCLHEASTPLINRIKPNIDKYFSNHDTVKICKSDSDLSSADEYVTVGSGFSNNSSTHSVTKDMLQTEKQFKAIHNEVIASNPRSINTITKTTNSINNLENVKVSNSNLTNLPVKLKGSLTNLKVMDTKLKGSYTNLKPVGKNLPHAPVPNTYMAKSNLHLSSNIQEMQVPVTTSDTSVQSKLKAPSAKPQGKASALPRPISTGIPRSTSRIPMPGYSRPASSKSSTRSISKYNNF